MNRTSGPKPILILNVTESNVIIDKLVDLAKFAVDNEIGLQFSNLLVVEGSYADRNKCLTKIADIPDEQVPAAWEIIGDLPERIAAQNPNSYLALGRLYDLLKQRAEAISFNRFVPSPNESFYRSFATLHRKNPYAFLRKIFRSFADCHRGILITSGSTLIVRLPYIAAKLRYRTIWCKDGHADTFIGPAEEVSVGPVVSISTAKTGGFYTHVLVEVLSYEMETESTEVRKELVLSEPRLDVDAHSEEIGVPEGGIDPTGTTHDQETMTLYTSHLPDDHERMAEFLNAEGELQFQENRLENARACFEMAIAHDSTHACAHSNLGVLLRRQGNIRPALEHLHRAMELKPHDPDTLHHYASALASTGKRDAAEQYMRSYLQHKPSDEQAWEEYRELFGSGFANRRSEGLGPGVSKIYLAMGRRLHQEGDILGAAEAFQTAAALDPEDPLPYYSLAQLHRQLNYPQEAEDMLAEAIQRDPFSKEDGRG